jgi:hypothetical protein
MENGEMAGANTTLRKKYSKIVAIKKYCSIFAAVIDVLFYRS